jgi:four helix bundle protein
VLTVPGGHSAHSATVLTVPGGHSAHGAKVLTVPQCLEDLVAWQFSTELGGAVLQITRSCKGAEDAEWCAQIRDAAESAPSLIAEGFVRFTTAEFVRYLRMARGELGEIQNCLHTGAREEYLSPEDHERLWNLAGRAMGTPTNLLKPNSDNRPPN